VTTGGWSAAGEASGVASIAIVCPPASSRGKRKAPPLSGRARP
jgi:hypothetical protein